jgi:two-component system aerobic respiration control sensor histidine kinase ArcB
VKEPLRMLTIGYLKNIIEITFGLALFINALLFIPQAVRIFREKSAIGVSLLTFLGFVLIQFVIILHGLIHKDYPLIIGYLFSMLSCGIVVTLILFYRSNDKKLTESYINIEEIVAQLPEHIYWKDKNCICLGCNTNNWKDFGLASLAEFKGKTDYDLFTKEEADHLRLIDEEVMRTGQMRTVEEKITLNGKTTLYLSHKLPLKNKNQEIIGILGVSVNITKAKQETENRLTMLENVIAVMPGNVYWMNKEGVYLGCNDNQAKVIGFSSRDQIIGKRNSEIPGFLIPEVLDPINAEIMNFGKTVITEEPAILNGVSATYLSHKVPLLNGRKEIIGMVGVSVDITDRKKAENDLKLAKETAVTANKAKTEFLYNMRHDLRTPFSGILGVAEFLENSEEDAQKKKTLGYITQASKVLLDQLNQIFEFIHSENGQLPILETQFNLHELVSNTFKMMNPAAKNKSLKFTSELDENIPQLLIGDHVRTQRILINLVSNSIKFTENGYVKLLTKLIKTDNKNIVVEFIIEDSGIGIPEEKRNLIFEQFNRLTSSYSGIYPGKGLGLRMVKKFLDEINGEVQVESNDAKGSTFKVFIPFRQSLLDASES